MSAPRLGATIHACHPPQWKNLKLARCFCAFRHLSQSPWALPPRRIQTSRRPLCRSLRAPRGVPATVATAATTTLRPCRQLQRDLPPPHRPLELPLLRLLLPQLQLEHLPLLLRRPPLLPPVLPRRVPRRLLRSLQQQQRRHLPRLCLCALPHQLEAPPLARVPLSPLLRPGARPSPRLTQRRPPPRAPPAPASPRCSQTRTTTSPRRSALPSASPRR